MPHDASREPSGDDHDADLGTLVLSLIGSRHSVAPKRLLSPGPDAAQLLQMVEAAACAPDHRSLRPWRLLRVADHQRDALADLFEACTRERLGDEPPPDASDIAKSREKAYRAPLLLLAVLKTAPADPEVPVVERAVTLGAALMNLLLAAHGLGYGAMLTSGRAVRTVRFHQAFGLADDEQALCFVSVGTPANAQRRGRGTAADFLGDWTSGPAAPAPAAAVPGASAPDAGT